MKHATATLLAALLFAAPAFAQDGGPLGEEAETDLQVVNGVPVNPELLERIREADGGLSTQELIEMSIDVMEQQREQLAEQNGPDQSWMGQDPLGHLENEMQELVMEIDEGDTAERTQARGQEVVDKMGMLIAMLEETCSACSQCSGSGSRPGNGNGPANGNNPANQSTLSAGPGGEGDLSARGEGNNLFGELDPEQRDAILRARQGQQGFSPEIDALLDEYYQRLASEQALDTAEDAGDE